MAADRRDGRRPAWGASARSAGFQKGHLLGEVGAPVVVGLCVAVAAWRGEEFDVADDAVVASLLLIGTEMTGLAVPVWARPGEHRRPEPPVLWT
jgi:hypothetical protein